MSSSAALALTAVLLLSCSRNPATGERQLTLVSEKQEIELGRNAAREVAATIGLVDNPGLQTYVSRLGKQLAQKAERPQLPWSFAVVDDPTPNAFALPGGFIFITRGLLAYLSSEAELAMVLGHEIGHVTARHSVERISQQEVAQLGLGLGMILVPDLARYGELAGAGVQLLFLKFSRDDERQADDLGFRYALADNYDVRSGARVFATLAAISRAEGGGRLPGWLQTHPDPQDRLQKLEQKAAHLEVAWNQLKRDRETLLEHLDKLVVGRDPRQGYFANGLFLYPKLHLKLTLPPGWRAENQPQALVVTSPQNDAAILLTQVADASSAQAAQSFAKKPGILVEAFRGRCGHRNVPGTCLKFAAQTQQGVMRGYTGFFGVHGSTVQLLAFAPEARFRSYDPLLANTMTALDVLEDPEALAVQPARLAIVRLPRAMTLAQLNVEQPSTVGLDTLALLNGVSPNELLPEGRLVKRVVGAKPIDLGFASQATTLLVRASSWRLQVLHEEAR